MSDPIGGIAPSTGDAPKKRGRPKGARNRSSGDLAKVFAHVSGATPGQQLIDLVAVTPKDIRLAKEWARGLPVVMKAGQMLDLRALHPRILGMVWKAHNLALLNGWELDHAWALMMKGADILMPYVHQKQGSAEPEKADRRPTIYMGAETLGTLANPSQAIETEEQLLFGPAPLTHGGSHMGAEGLAPQGVLPLGSPD